ncbi:POU class 2 homeobox associating factor 3 isoform X2 [Arvicanthis niloticus]|uniref:colorectal cancer-associated protein 2 n=2 Tax=Arvicanthis niloticus TaxID=61156 RepID=UPI0014866F75|nr:colorectal cancer-associated protein 2 [Arvicanthis niloticus]
MTVRELLQQRRAHQAASGATLSESSSLHPPDTTMPSPAGLYLEPEPTSSAPSYFQAREFSTCVSCEESPSCLDQIFESYLQTDTLPEPLLNSAQIAPHYLPESCQEAPFCHNQSLIPGSPSDSFSLSGSFGCSYSPTQLPSCTPENYTSPPSLDSLHSSLPEEGYFCQHWPSHPQYNHSSPATPSSVCYYTSCEAEHLDALRSTEFFSYSGMDCVDFVPSAATTGDFYKRETSCDSCYS